MKLRLEQVLANFRKHRTEPSVQIRPPQTFADYCRIAQHGIDPIRHQRDLQVLAFWLDLGNNSEGFIEQASTNPLFVVADVPFANRGGLLDSLADLPSIEVPQLAAVKFDFSREEAVRQFYVLYRSYYRKARLLGETKIEAARRAVQFVDLFLIDSLGDRNPQYLRALQAVKKQNPRDCGAKQRYFESYIPQDYLQNRLFVLSQSRNSFVPSELEQLLPINLWVEIIRLMVLSNVYCPAVKNLLKPFTLEALMEILEASRQSSYYCPAAHVFTALALRPESIDLTVALCELRQILPAGFWLWLTQEASRVPEFQQAFIRLLFVEGRVLSVVEKFLQKIGAEVMLKKGPDAFTRWTQGLKDMLAEVGLQGLVDAALKAQYFRAEEGRYLHGCNWQGRRDDVVSVSEFLAHEAHWQAVQALQWHSEEKQAYMLLDLAYGSARNFATCLSLVPDLTPRLLGRLAELTDGGMAANLLRNALELNLSAEETYQGFASVGVRCLVELIISSHNFGSYGVDSPVDKKATYLFQTAIKEIGLERFAGIYHSAPLPFPAGALYNYGFITKGQLKRLFADLALRDKQIVFETVALEELPAVIDEAQAVNMAEVFHQFSWGSDNFSEVALLLAELYPATRTILLKKLSEVFFAGSLAQHREGSSKVVGRFNTAYLQYAARTIAKINFSGVEAEVIERAQQGLLRWFAFYYATRGVDQHSLMVSLAAKRFNLDQDPVVARAFNANHGSDPEPNIIAAKPYYQAFRYLGGVIRPYDGRSARFELMQDESQRFPFFNKQGMLTVVADGMSYELELSSGRVRLNQDRYIAYEPGLKFFKLEQAESRDLYPEIDRAFSLRVRELPELIAASSGRAQAVLIKERDSLQPLEQMSGLSLGEIRPSQLFLMMSVNRARKLLAVAFSNPQVFVSVLIQLSQHDKPQSDFWRLISPMVSMAIEALGDQVAAGKPRQFVRMITRDYLGG